LAARENQTTSNKREERVESSRIIVVGPPRSGTTLFASLLAQLGVNFGLEQRKWDINSGYYEHPDLLKIYGQLRKYERVVQISDNLASHLRNSVIRSLSSLLAEVEAIKYPPISTQLPFLVDRAGYQPRLAISARQFEPYAISRMRMEGVGYSVCKRDYLEIYQSALLLLQVYQGEVIHYEGLLSPSRQPSLERLALLTQAPLDRVRQVVENNVGVGRSRPGANAEDPECRAVYDQLVALAG
jgi:hypothetical protein